MADSVVYEHLAGEHTIGVYPLLEDDSCYFLAFDFDEADWRDDARALMHFSEELGISAALEISRSGKGAHVWIFLQQKFLPAMHAGLALSSSVISVLAQPPLFYNELTRISKILCLINVIQHIDNQVINVPLNSA